MERRPAAQCAGPTRALDGLAMTVYIVLHSSYGDEDQLQGIYLREKDAKEACITRTQSGRKSTAYDSHTEACCRVEEYEVIG